MADGNFVIQGVKLLFDPVHKKKMDISCGGSNRSILPQIHPESPGNGVSDVPDLKLSGNMPSDLPIACCAFSTDKFEPLFTKSWIRPR